MASQYNDRILWLCLGVTLFFAARGIAAELYRVKELTEIKKGEKEEPVIGQATEDALKLETLQKLSESSSFDLRAAALRIVSERSTKGSTRSLLLKDLSSGNPARRRKALTALHFLVSNPALSRSAVSTRLRDISTLTALVDCLCHFLKEHTEQTGTTISPIRPQTRPVGENKALKTLYTILSGNIPAALEAGVISRWLTNYPFPCAVQDETKKRNIVFMMKTWWSDDPIMSSIINTLSSHQEGLKQLRKYGLMGSRMEEHTADSYGNDIHDDYDVDLDDDDDDGDDSGVHDYDTDDHQDHDNDSDSDVWMVDGEGTAGAPPWLGRRPQENSAEEQALRRRRREAMVFSEGGRPLVQDNIFHPINGLDDDWGIGPRRRSFSSRGVDAPVEQAPQRPESTQSRWRLLWPF